MPVPKGATIDPERTHATILAAATQLLYERGLDGVGIAELCSHIGVSKETLYRHFGTKGGLVRAVLEARSDRVMRRLTDAVTSAGDDPHDQLSALFDALQRWYDEPDFRGCAMVNAATQHHVQHVRTITSHHLDRYLGLLIDISECAGAIQPHLVARQILMLIEGATIIATHHNRAVVGDHARDAALTLLSAASCRVQPETHARRR